MSQSSREKSHLHSGSTKAAAALKTLEQRPSGSRSLEELKESLRILASSDVPEGIGIDQTDNRPEKTRPVEALESDSTSSYLSNSRDDEV